MPNEKIRHINTGYIIPTITPDNYVLGSGQELKAVYTTDGHWLKFQTLKEVQTKDGTDVFNCTGFTVSNAYEFIFKRIYNLVFNFSDRAIGILANTVVGVGNDPWWVAETVRKNGMINEAVLPFNVTGAEYYKPKPLPQNMVDAGKDFLKQWKLGNQHIGNRPDQLKEGLKLSPIGVGVTAWYKNDEGLYYSPQGVLPGHNVIIIDYEDGKFFYIYDSYDEDVKKLVWDFNFWYPIGYSVAVNTDPQKISIIQQILNLAYKALNLLFQLKEKVVIETPQLSPITEVITPFFPEPTQPVPEPTQISKLNEFCKSIERHEGYYVGSRSYRNCSPANFRYTEYIKSLGASGHDAQNYAIFPSYPVGFEALKQFVRDAGNNLLKNYHDKDILGFFQVFAPSSDNNAPEIYAKFVASEIKAEITTKLKDII